MSKHNKTLIDTGSRNDVVDFLDLVRQHPDVLNQGLKDKANQLYWEVRPKRRYYPKKVVDSTIIVL